VSDKPVAAFVAFLFVFPLTVVCCAGPAALVSGVVATVAWLSQSMVWDCPGSVDTESAFA
jgi:predicted short-subunit dehydrogenase-like oxidoreductase (DUF2520 family)